MSRIAALTLAGIVALGTVACASASAPHTPAPVNTVSTVKPASEWQVPSSVATVALVPSDNIAPDKSYSGYQAPEPTPCQEDEPCWDCHTMGNLICGPVAAPVAVAPAYVPPAVVYVTGTPVVTSTVVKAPAPVAVPTVKPTPVAVPTPTPSATCPPLLHKDGVNITPPNAPAYCVYAQ